MRLARAHPRTGTSRAPCRRRASPPAAALKLQHPAREGHSLRNRFLGPLFALTATLFPGATAAEVIPVRFPEGVAHGFLALRTLDGKTLADGDLIQSVRDDRVTSRLVLRFHDGSVHDETVVFSQRRSFRFLSDHLVQKGPAFRHPMEVSIDGKSGKVTVSYTEDGKEKTISERMELPPDLANGLMLALLKNIDPRAPLTTVSLVAATPKPRLVKLAIAPTVEDPFTVGSSPRKATHFVVHMEIGGLAGLVAPLLGKQPPDTHVWVLEGDAPAFVGSEGPFAAGGPVWRLELASPSWPRAASPTPP